MELKHTISKFWPRVGALLIDFIILGFFGFTLGMTFESFFVSIEHQGLLIGLIVALIYFTLGNSSVFKGQTIGKKALDIKTINASGSALSIKNSFFRSFILITPYFLINYPIPGVAYLSVIDIIKGSFLISILIGYAVMYIANKPSRQSFHDILMESFVVDISESDTVTELKSNRAIGMLLSAVISILIVGYTTLANTHKSAEFNNLENIARKIGNIDGVIRVGANKNTTVFNGDEKSISESFTLTLHVQEIPIPSEFEESDIVKKAISQLFQIDPKLKNLDIINIRLYRGFNIGIAKMNWSHSARRTPEEWSEIL